MDMRFEAAPMAANAGLLKAVVMTVQRFIDKVTVLMAQVASFSCPSIAGTSLSAVSPDYNYFGGMTAVA